MEKDRKYGALAVRGGEALRGLALATVLAVGLKGSVGGQTVSEIKPTSTGLATTLYLDDVPKRLSSMYLAQEGLKDMPDDVNSDNSQGKRVTVVFPPSPSPEPVVLAPKPEQTTPPDWKLDPEISWYGPGLYGKRTACGLKLTTELEGVASRTLPCGTLVTFKSKDGQLTVPVVDRGPYVAGRIFDLTAGACKDKKLNHCYTGPIYYTINK